jgi:hypothetical protein
MPPTSLVARRTRVLAGVSRSDIGQLDSKDGGEAVIGCGEFLHTQWLLLGFSLFVLGGKKY